MKYRFRRRLLYTLLLAVDYIFLLLPYRIALGVGKAIGTLISIILVKYRMLAKSHLRLAFGDSKSEKELSSIAQSVFVNLAINVAEIFCLPKIKDKFDDIIDIVGIEKFDNALKEGKGAIAITAHLGNWELIPMYFASKGYPSNVIARPIYYEKYDEWVSFLRNSMGVNVIYRTESPKKILKLLKKNELVGILPDQDVDSVDGIFVDFFGKSAYTPSAPAKIALATGSPIIPIFIIRGSKKHTIYVEDPICVDKNLDKNDAVNTYTKQLSDVIESYIRKHPEQWVWMHKRWKTRPENEID